MGLGLKTDSHSVGEQPNGLLLDNLSSLCFRELGAQQVFTRGTLMRVHELRLGITH